MQHPVATYSSDGFAGKWLQVPAVLFSGGLHCPADQPARDCGGEIRGGCAEGPSGFPCGNCDSDGGRMFRSCTRYCLVCLES